MRSSVLFVLLAGCASASSDAALGDLRTRLTEAQRKEADARRRIDELENRVFLMNDQLESAKIASAAVRAPRLPVVTLRPTEEGGRQDPEGARSEEEIEFTGAARSVDAHHVRPVLRGDGDSGTIVAETPRRTTRPHTVAATPPTESSTRFVAQGGGDSLGVAPVPPIPKGPATEPIRVTAPALPAAERTRFVGKGGEVPVVDEEPLRAYRTAYAELTAGRFDEAERQLRAFVKRYPRHDYADNAQYWLGESFYARHRYREAAIEFRSAVARYPVGNKAPDALLKLAYSLLSLNETAEARRLLEELPGSYPRSEAARLATQKLGELGGRPASTTPEDSR